VRLSWPQLQVAWRVVMGWLRCLHAPRTLAQAGAACRRCSLEPEEVIEQIIGGVCIPDLHLLRAVIGTEGQWPASIGA